MSAEQNELAPLRLQEGGGAWERELLASTAGDSVPTESRARVAAGLGLAAAAGPAAPAPAPRPSLELGALPQLLALGLAGGLALVLSLPAGSPAPRGASPPELLTAPASLSLPVAATPSEAGAAALPAAPPPPLRHPIAQRPTRAARRIRHDATPSTPMRVLAGAVADPLIAEVQQLDRVRTALQAARGEVALGLLDAYSTQFPEGKLALEGAVLRVRALSEVGQHAAAAQLARRTLALPGSQRYRADLQRAATPLTPGDPD